MNVPGVSCKECIFHDDDPSICRRRAPIGKMAPMQGVTVAYVWPDVRPDEWCGDFRGIPKEEVTVAAGDIPMPPGGVPRP